jgi:hypothetical protein
MKIHCEIQYYMSGHTELPNYRQFRSESAPTAENQGDSIAKNPGQCARQPSSSLVALLFRDQQHAL